MSTPRHSTYRDLWGSLGSYTTSGPRRPSENWITSNNWRCRWTHNEANGTKTFLLDLEHWTVNTKEISGAVKQQNRRPSYFLPGKYHATVLNQRLTNGRYRKDLQCRCFSTSFYLLIDQIHSNWMNCPNFGGRIRLCGDEIIRENADFVLLGQGNWRRTSNMKDNSSRSLRWVHSAWGVGKKDSRAM